jgi:methyl-accepting chemotaxis protein
MLDLDVHDHHLQTNFSNRLTGKILNIIDMGMSDLTHSKGWKTLMGYVYGVGASIVLLGALFKLQHWPGGGPMLTIGMSAEALIFFLSVFEPAMEIPDWAKVYPQLRENFSADDFDELYDQQNSSKKVDISSMFQEADISSELLEKVKKSLQDLSNTAHSLSDISTATVATDVYVRNLNSASESMNTFAVLNSRANESIDKSLDELTKSYSQTSDIISKSSKEVAETISNSSKTLNLQLSESGSKLADSFKQFSESISGDFDSLNKNSESYSNELEKINNNLSSLNASYEMQLESANKQAKTSTNVHEDFAKMNELLTESMKNTELYSKQAVQLNKNLEALNQVYGNMLGAMNLKG